MVMVVRDRRPARVQFLQRRFAGKAVEVIADRRHGDRRHQLQPLRTERRTSGRRCVWTARWANSDFVVVSSTTGPHFLVPEPGDVLLSKEWQSEDSYSLAVIPGSVQARYDTYELAIERARRFATFAGVDLWYTEDSRAFILVGPYRHPTEPLAAAPHESGAAPPLP